MKKKFLLTLSAVVCALCCAFGLAACSKGTEWMRPVFTFAEDGYAIEFIDNTEKDFTDFGIEGVKLDHSKYAQDKLVEYRWVIYCQGEVVGWIEADGGYDNNKNGGYKYGFSTSYNNGVYGYFGMNFYVILKTTDLTVFDRLKIDSDYGKVVKTKGDVENPYSATIRYPHFDEETNQSAPAAGSENFVCCVYHIELDQIDAPGIDTINITLSFIKE